MVDDRVDKDAIRNEFDRRADSGERSVAWNDAIEIIADFAQLKPTDRVLDVACGGGTLTFQLASRCAYAAGVDLSENMIALASEHEIETGVDNVSFQVGDADSLEFEDGSFNRVVCRLGLHHFSDPARALREMTRLVTTPGYLIIADLISSEGQASRDAHNRIERSRDPAHVCMYSPKQVAEMFEGLRLTVERKRAWETRRRFRDWMKLADADRGSLERTRRMMIEAAKKKSTDLDIAIHDKVIEFTHRWVAWSALKLR